MKYPFPIRVPKGCSVKITQKYANTTNNEWYKENGIDAPYHNGVDAVLLNFNGVEDKHLTYGASLLWTLPVKGIAVKKTYDTPLSTKGNGITVESEEFTHNGERTKLQVVYWHCAELSDKKTFKAEEAVAYIGNSGLVAPAPSAFCVNCGAHLHLMVFVFKYQKGWKLQNSDNGVKGAVDPLDWFDPNLIISGEDTEAEKDLLPFGHFIGKIKEAISKLKGNK